MATAWAAASVSLGLVASLAATTATERADVEVVGLSVDAMTEGRAIYAVGSGEYHFSSSRGADR
jgi:hypothetical protein